MTPDTDERVPSPHSTEEYLAAQDSAQHHDNLIWTATGLVWTDNFVLLGFIIQSTSSGDTGLFVPLASFLGALLTAAAWRMVLVWNEVMNAKYRRCRELEVQLRMNQHRAVEAIYPRGEMKFWYGLVSVIFLVAWLVYFVYGAWSLWIR